MAQFVRRNFKTRLVRSCVDDRCFAREKRL